MRGDDYNVKEKKRIQVRRELSGSLPLLKNYLIIYLLRRINELESLLRAYEMRL